MNLSDWSAIAEIIAAVGLIVSLLYVAIEVHQNTKQEKTKALQVALKEFLDSYEAATSSVTKARIFRMGLNNFDSLSSDEMGCFHATLHSLLTGFNNVWNLHKSGLLPEHELVAMRGVYVSLLSSPGGAKWWELFKHVPPPHLIEYLDEAVRRADGQISPATETFPWLQAD